MSLRLKLALMMTPLVIAVVAIVVLAVLVATGDAAGLSAASIRAQARGASTVTIGVGDDFYSRRSLTVRRGTTVKWVWHRTSDRHTVTTKSGPTHFSSRKLRGSHTYKQRLAKGTYRIFCKIHPSTMRLTVKVR